MYALQEGKPPRSRNPFVPHTPTQVRDGLVSVVLPLLLARRGVLLQVLTRERVELVHDIQVGGQEMVLAVLVEAPFIVSSIGWPACCVVLWLYTGATSHSINSAFSYNNPEKQRFRLVSSGPNQHR